VVAESNGLIKIYHRSLVAMVTKIWYVQKIGHTDTVFDRT